MSRLGVCTFTHEWFEVLDTIRDPYISLSTSVTGFPWGSSHPVSVVVTVEVVLPCTGKLVTGRV